jgi:hypothetical protein
VDTKVLEQGIAAVVTSAITAALAHVPDDKVTGAIDSVLDKLQGMVDGTATPLDDAVLEPVIGKVRSSLKVA